MEGLVNADGVLLDLNQPKDVEANDLDSCGAGDGGLDTKRTFSELDSLSDQIGFNDVGEFAEEDENDGKDRAEGNKEDPIFNDIKVSIARCHSSAKSHTSSTDGSETSPHVKVSNKFLSLPHGLVPWATYEHGKRSSDIMGVTYNGRMRQFIILDSKGITSWKRDAVEHRVSRDLEYPKYEYRLITNVIYAKKHNCYFVLGKDFSLKVYNRDFYETCSVSADLRSVLFMLFNPVRDELITGGVGGTKVWRFHQQSGITPTMLRPLANYGLTLKYELPSVGGSWVKRVELDHHLEHLYCCSDTDLHVYDLAGKLLFKFERAHMMSITGCRYSRAASVLVTSSIDCEVKVWSLMGGLIHTFRGHSRAVTNLILHPATSSIVLTCSLDGTVRMWSLDTMDCLYSLVVSVDGLLWMGLTDDNMLFISTARTVTMWHMNYNVQFWAMARSKVNRMELCGSKEKTTRLMAISEDSSVRLMARSNHKSLCTVLPPPSISPLQRVLSVCYSREFNTIYMLINPHEIWVYTTRTDPACRIAVWDVIDIQASFSANKQNAATEDSKPSSNKPAPTHRATECGAGNEPVANCCCLTILNSTAIVWTDEGCCCPIRDSYLLLGLEDGRILFMDPVMKGHKYLEFKTGKDPVLDMYHDTRHQSLVTVYKLPGLMQIHVWGLPDLEMQHEVYTTPDLRGHARLGYMLVTAHESGSVIFHALEHATDPGLHKSKMIPVLEEVVDVNHKPQHLAPVIALDVCSSVRIFCSCSKDGAIKIWTEDEALLTEIMLDNSLTSACFLNNMGDMVIGYQKQIFCINHSKVCPQLTVPESDVDTFDKESFICEDPAVMYEGVSPNPDPVTLDNYLVPFDIEFSKDFLEGKVTLEPESVKEEESDSESVHSHAATETYLSPPGTPRRRLSLVDLTLGSEVSKYDLLKHMKRTLKHLAEKEKVDAAQLAFEQMQEDYNSETYKRQRRLARMRGGALDERDGGGKPEQEKALASEGIEGRTEGDGLNSHDYESFSFPHFGESPGPTPRSTPAGTPEVLSEAEEHLEEVHTEEDTSVKKVTVQVVKVEENEDEISKFLAVEREKANEVKDDEPRALPPKRKFGFGNVSVDAKALMKDGKKAGAVSGGSRRAGTEAGSSPRKEPESDSDSGEKKGKRSDRSRKKMLQTSQRKGLKQKRAEKDLPDPREPPPTQMQALEQQENNMRSTGDENFSHAEMEGKSTTSKRRPPPDQDKGSDKKDLKSTASCENLGRGEDGVDGMGLDLTVEKTAATSTEARDLVLGESAAATVPELPHIPNIASKPNSAESQRSSLKTPMQGQARPRSGIDFSPAGVAGLTGKGGDNQDSLSLVSGVSASAATAVADSPGLEAGTKSGVSESAVDQDGRKSALSTEGSEDSKAAFRLSLLAKEPCYEETASEGGLSVAAPDSGWTDQDIISVSRQQVRSADPAASSDLDDTSDYHRGRPGLSMLGEDGFQQSQSEAVAEVKVRERPNTAAEDRALQRPELQNALTFFRQRPHTAQMRFKTEDLQTAFDTSLTRYKKLSRAPLASDTLYRNADQAFSEDWHERQVERHMLIRMQKELRSQNVERRRQAIQARKQEQLQRKLEAQETQLFQRRAQPHGPLSGSAPPPPTPPARASTVHGSRPTVNVPAPTPVSSRPHTAAAGDYSRKVSGSNPYQYHHHHPLQHRHHHQRNHHQHQSQQLFQQNYHQYDGDSTDRQLEMEADKRLKAELSHQKPFRFKLRDPEPQHDSPAIVDIGDGIDPWLLDPRNPQAVRPKSSKSIPSKCNRYVLVTKPRAHLQIPLPTPLEEQLLATRFPQQGEKVFRQYEDLLFRPPRRPEYGINYSPYEHQLYG